MLSRYASKHDLAFNIKIVGHGKAFAIGKNQETTYAFVFDGLTAFAIFAFSPFLATFAKLYIDGHVDCEGDWFDFAKTVDKLGDSPFRWIIKRLATAKGVDVHYGWSPEAFACFLDRPYMQYTSGRGSHEVGATTESVQLNKLRFIAQCVRARNSQRHLDVGCGWGGLTHYFTHNFLTTSHGVTIAHEQASYARSHVQAQFYVSDFADHTPPEPYDFATAVGVLEHIPISRHAEFFRWLATRIHTDSRVYVQCITRDPMRSQTDRTRLLNQFVFQHELTTIADLKKLAQMAGFEVEMEEEGHEDYGFTTQQWVERMRAHETEIKKHLNDDRVYRALLGYLTMASLVMADNRCNLHRLLLVKK